MTIKEQETAMKKAGILIAILAGIFILMIKYNTANAQSFNLKAVQKSQYERSFEKWKKDQPKKKIEAVKYAVWASNENYKESKSNQKLNRRIERIRQKIK